MLLKQPTIDNHSGYEALPHKKKTPTNKIKTLYTTKYIQYKETFKKSPHVLKLFITSLYYVVFFLYRADARQN